MKMYFKKPKGVAALTTVLIIGAATLLMGVTAAYVGLSELDMGYTSQKSGEAFVATDGCMEETYRRIRLDQNYGVGSGTITLTLSNGSCTIDVSDLGSNQRRIIITGTVGDYNKKIQSEISIISTVISVLSWEELTT